MFGQSRSTQQKDTAVSETTKQLNELIVGERVSAVGDRTFDQPYAVTEIRKVTVRGRTFTAFVKLEGGRFWPTGADDRRIVTVQS